MKKRKQKIGLYDLGRVPLSQPVIKEPNYRTMKQLRAEDEAAERERQARQKAEAEEKLTAPVRALETAIKVAARENSERVAAFYSKPLQVMSDAGIDVAPNDMSGDYPLQEGAKDPQADAAAYRQFKEDLASRGCTLNDSGWARLGTFLAALYYHRNISLASVGSWEIGLERLAADLGVFQSEELNNYQRPQPKPVAQPEPVASELTFDEILAANSTESREGRQRIVAAAEMDNFKQATPVQQDWLRHIRDTYGFDVSEEDRKYILNVLFPRNNWSYTRPDHYEAARRAMVHQHRWPSTMLTLVERISEELEDTPTSDYFKYREVKMRLQNAERMERAKNSA